MYVCVYTHIYMTNSHLVYHKAKCSLLLRYSYLKYSNPGGPLLGLHACMYVCASVYVCVCARVCIHTYIHTCIQTLEVRC
jgi:hypothetical protein